MQAVAINYSVQAVRRKRRCHEKRSAGHIKKPPKNQGPYIQTPHQKRIISTGNVCRHAGIYC